MFAPRMYFEIRSVVPFLAPLAVGNDLLQPLAGEDGDHPDGFVDGGGSVVLVLSNVDR